MESKPGLKTVERLADFPFINSAFANASDYYGRIKERNILTRASCSLAELSFKTMLFAATPVTSLCKKPIEKVDGYLSGKLEELETTYPGLTKPTEALVADVKEVYDKNIKVALDHTSEGIKKYGADQVQSVRTFGYDKLHQTAYIGHRLVDACLENRLAKLITEPMLTVTEKSLDYLLPEAKPADSQDSSDHPSEPKAADNKTLTRIANVNHRVYEAAFQQMALFHTKFAYNIHRLQSMSDVLALASKEKLGQTIHAVANNSLFSQCVKLVQTNKIPFSELESVANSYYKVIMKDMSQMIERYIKLLQHFPVVFNTSRLRKISQDLSAKVKFANLRGVFPVNLSSSVDQLLILQGALVMYTNQILKVFGDSRLVKQLLTASASKSQSNGSGNVSDHH